jgi:hypothetical protein
MADFGAPVAQGVDVSPSKGFQTLSDLVGLKQKQQALDTGAFTQQSAQAEAAIKQQGAKENQAGAQLLSDPVGNGLTDDDGNPMKGARAKILAAMPTTGDSHYQDLLTAAKGHVEFKKAALNLRGDVKSEASARLAGVAADPNAGLPEIQDAITNLKNDYAGTPAENDVNTIANVSKQAVDAAAKSHGVAGAKQVIMGFSRGYLTNAGITGAGGVAGPPQATSNAAGQTQNRDPMTGALSAPPLGPGATNPASPTVAGATTRQVKTGNADVDTSNTVVDAQRDARANIDLTKRIDQLAEVVRPGAAASKIRATLGALGLQDANQAQTELDKDLARLKGSLASRAQSDTRAGPILEQIPDSAKPTDTIHQAMDITRGFNRQDLALGQLREKSSKATGGQMNGFQGDYAHAVAAASPLMHEYLALSPTEQVDFYKRNFKTREQAQAFRDQARSVKRMSPDVIGQ